jgi:hypothetical protein
LREKPLRNKVKLLVPVLAGALGLLAIPAAGAHAETISSLTQLTSFHQMVVDDVGSYTANGYVFLSGGTDSEQLLNGPLTAAGIVVTDLSGNYVTTLDAGHGVEGLALSADGGTLYASLGSDDAVAAINVSSITPATTTPAQALYDLGAGQLPYDLAIQSGELWVSYVPQTGFGGQSAIGSFDLSQANPSFVLAPGTSGWPAPPNLSADPSNGGILVAAEPQESPAEVATYSVVGGTVTTLAPMQELRNASGGENCENETDLAVVPGGTQFIVACGWPYAHYYYSTTDLSLLGQYVSNTYPDAVAIAPGSGLLALGTGNQYAPEIYLYKPGGSTLLYEHSFGSYTGVNLAGRGLALSEDGSELYAVTFTTSGTGSKYSLHVFSNPAAAVTLTGPSVGIAGNSLTLTGTVALPTGTPPPAGATVTITRTAAGSKTPLTLPPVSTAADGTFTLSDTPTAPGTYTYAARYGDSSPGSVVVDVAPDTTTLTLSGPDSLRIGSELTLSGTLTFDGNPAPAGTTVTVTRSWSGSSDTTTFPVTTAADGTFTVTERLTSFGTFSYTAQYAGSPTAGPATAQWTVTVPHPGAA